MEAASPLAPHGVRATALKRARIPSHAFSEADRLLARPNEAAAFRCYQAADTCWRNWRKPAVTTHDGQVRANHPIIVRALNRVQSATSLRLMLRDPLAFVWRYALGWRSLVGDEQPLSLDARAYGELVHEMLKRAVDALEPKPGILAPPATILRDALDAASTAIGAQWPVERSTPPFLLWRHTLAAARDLALKALTLDEAWHPDTRSWTELAFGLEDHETDAAGDLLWPPTAQVVIPGAGMRIRGSMDRVDFNGAHNRVRVSDYKTGAEPPKASEIIIGRGAELQRVLYALATRQLVAGNPQVVARLVFLGADRLKPYSLPDIDHAIADISGHVRAAVHLLRRGIALPGPDAREDSNDFALALPAAPAVYFQNKQAALGRAFGDFARVSELAMTKLADESERLRALTELHLTLLVEAAAGTGKTALMAGRVTMLLASGAEPCSVTAITFTELAASALGARIHRYVDDLLAGRIPKPLREALPGGLTDLQRHALSAAACKLDELMATTIHAFCQTIICSYAVEADIDPGARMLDATQAEATFDAVFEQWFRRRLNGTVRADDPIASLSRYDPHHVAATLQALARFRLEHRGARAPVADLSGRPDNNLIDAVADFRRWLSAQPVEPKTLELIGQLEKLADHFVDSFATPPRFETLWRLAHPARLPCMRRHTLDLLSPRTKAAWDKAAGKDRGAELNAEALRHFARIDHCYRAILGRVATALVAKLSDELDEVLSEYATFKRAAAFLDFDDLLERARALVCEHNAIRKALGQRYRHIFVDEFQDTDPLQAEILFRIAADDSPPRWQDSRLRPGALFIVGDPKQAIYRFRGADVSSYAEARRAIVGRWPSNVVQIRRTSARGPQS